MQTIIITKEAQDAIRKTAELPFKETARPNADGTLSIDVDDEVFSSLAKIQFKGETLSDTLVRLCQFYKNPRKQ